MANYADVKAIIDTYIKRNGIKAITGNVLNSVLTKMLNELGAGYQYGGMAVPSIDPGTPDYNVVYLAATAGTYTDFDGILLGEGEIALLKYNGSWSKETVGSFYTRTDVDTMLDGYVEKEPGKGLSTNDYTDEDKAKLDGVEDGAQVNVIEGVSVNGTLIDPDENKVVDVEVPTDLAELNEDAEHRLVTDDDIANWDAKYDKPAGGIPAEDLAQAVRDLLALADSSLQPSAIVQETGQQTGKVMSQKAVTDAVAAVESEVSQLGQKVGDIYTEVARGFAFAPVWNDNKLLRNNGGVTDISSGTYLDRCATTDPVDCSAYAGKMMSFEHLFSGAGSIAFYRLPNSMVSGGYYNFTASGTESIVIPATADFFRMGVTPNSSADLSTAKASTNAKTTAVISPVTKAFVKGAFTKLDYFREIYVPDKTKSIKSIQIRKAVAYSSNYRARVDVTFTDNTTAYFDKANIPLSEVYEIFENVVTDADNKFYILFSGSVPDGDNTVTTTELFDQSAIHNINFSPSINSYIKAGGATTPAKRYSEQRMGAMKYALPTDFDYSQILFFGQSFAQGGSSKTGTTGVIPNCYMFGDNVKAVAGTAFNPLEQNTYEYPVVSCTNALSQQYRRFGHNVNIVASTAGTSGVSIVTLLNQYVPNVVQMQQGMKSVADNENKTVGCFAIVYMQGETDYREGNVNDKATYKSYLAAVKTALQQSAMTNLGQTRKPVFFLYQTSGGNWIQNDGSANNEALGVSLAQVEFAAENDDVILVSPAYQVTRYSDGHPATNGERWLGEYYAKAIWQTLYRGFRYKNPVAMDVKVETAKITIYVSDCVLPLRKNTWTLPQKTNLGFVVKVNNTEVSIDSIGLVDNAIILNLATPIAPGATVKVSYGGVGVGQGNICDSDTWGTWLQYLSDSGDTGYDGTRIINQSPTAEGGGSLVGMDYPMNNFLCIFYKEITY